MAQAKMRGAERIREIDDLLDGWDGSAAGKPRKRSLTIAGHRTSISLEEPFWEGLRAIALARVASIAALVSAIDAVRGDVSLSSAIRLFVYAEQAGTARRSKRLTGARDPAQLRTSDRC
jgi:predicted DNA-binding ribbon-helix-helix protein